MALKPWIRIGEKENTDQKHHPWALFLAQGIKHAIQNKYRARIGVLVRELPVIDCKDSVRMVVLVEDAVAHCPSVAGRTGVHRAHPRHYTVALNLVEMSMTLPTTNDFTPNLGITQAQAPLRLAVWTNRHGRAGVSILALPPECKAMPILVHMSHGARYIVHLHRGPI
jgi:hypothetical protein